MTRLDDDVQEALAQMKGFMKNAKKRKIGLATLIRQEGTKIPNVSVFRMKPYYDEYGKNVIYWYDKTSLFVIPLGKYTNQEIMDSSLAITKSIKRQNRKYYGIKKYNFVYLIKGPNYFSPQNLKITTEIDGWTGNIDSKIYFYHLKPDVLFINWKENPLEGGK